MIKKLLGIYYEKKKRILKFGLAAAEKTVFVCFIISVYS